MKSWTDMLASIEAHNSPEHVRAALDAYFASWHAGDIDARAALFAEDASFADPVNAPPYEGLPAIRGFWEQTARFPVKMRPVVHRTIVCGDDALVVFTMFVDGPTGPLMCLEVHETFSFGPDGLIRSLRPFWDLASVNKGMPA